MFEIRAVKDLESAIPEIFVGLSGLEKEALLGVISRGLVIVPGGKWDRVGYLLPWQNTHVADAAESLIETGDKVAERVAGRAASYLLNSPGFYQLNPEGIKLAVNLFIRLGEKPEDIGNRVASVVGGENNYHTLSRYHQGLNPAREHIRVNHPKVYSNLWAALPLVITPVVIEGAVQEIKSRKGESTGGPVYFALEEMKRRFDSGDLEADITLYLNQYGWGSKIQSDGTLYDPITSEVNSDFMGKNAAESKLKFFRENQLPPFVQVSNDFEAELGQQQFKAKGYVRSRDIVNALNAEMEGMHKYVIDGLSQTEARLKEERERRGTAQQSFYKRLGRIIR